MVPDRQHFSTSNASLRLLCCRHHVCTHGGSVLTQKHYSSWLCFYDAVAIILYAELCKNAVYLNSTVLKEKDHLAGVCGEFQLSSGL